MRNWVKLVRKKKKKERKRELLATASKWRVSSVNPEHSHHCPCITAARGQSSLAFQISVTSSEKKAPGLLATAETAEDSSSMLFWPAAIYTAHWCGQSWWPAEPDSAEMTCQDGWQVAGKSLHLRSSGRFESPWLGGMAKIQSSPVTYCKRFGHLPHSRKGTQTVCDLVSFCHWCLPVLALWAQTLQASMHTVPVSVVSTKCSLNNGSAGCYQWFRPHPDHIRSWSYYLLSQWRKSQPTCWSFLRQDTESVFLCMNDYRVIQVNSIWQPNPLVYAGTFTLLTCMRKQQTAKVSPPPVVCACHMSSTAVTRWPLTIAVQHHLRLLFSLCSHGASNHSA